MDENVDEENILETEGQKKIKELTAKYGFEPQYIVEADGHYIIEAEESLIARIKEMQEEQDKEIEELREETLESIEEQLEKIELAEIEKEKQKASAKQLTEEEKAEIAQKARETTEYYAAGLWQRMFNGVSLYNEILGRVLYHVALSCVFDISKPIMVKKGEITDVKIGAFIVQNSGSGKNVGTNFLLAVLLGCIKYSPTVFRHGKATDAALLGGWIKHKTENGNEWEEVPGPLETNKLWLYEEAKPLINPEAYNEGIHEIWIATHESWFSPGNTYSKKLKSWPKERLIKSEAVGLATSRNLAGIDAFVVTSGAIQRVLFLPRELDDEIRRAMFQRNAGITDTEEDLENYDKQIKLLAAEICKVADFQHRNSISVKNDKRPEIGKFIEEKLMWFYDETVKLPDEEKREAMLSYVARYKTFLMKLSYHAAATRFSKDIELCDFEYAFDLLKEIFGFQITWLEKKIAKNWQEERKEDKFIEFLKNAIKNSNGEIKHSKLAKLVSQTFQCRIEAAYGRIKTRAKGEVPLIIVRDGFVRLNDGSKH